MLEILFLWWFCGKLATIAKAKNRSGSWGALGAVLWIAGEIGGLLVNIDVLDRGGGLGDVYPLMLGGALVGGAAAWLIVTLLQPRPRDGELPVARVV